MAMQRALDYAYRRGVTLVSAAGNGGADYTKVIEDTSSPNFASKPGEAPYPRTIPPSCISMPSEGNHVLAISSTGISKRKAYYSDYGNGYVDLSAPGGDVYDTPDNRRDVTKGVLGAYPERLAGESGLLDPNGQPLPGAGVVRDCRAGRTCAYYRYLQGTSMASPQPPASPASPSADGVSRIGGTAASWPPRTRSSGCCEPPLRTRRARRPRRSHTPESFRPARP